jgi:hypothetical protein
MTTDGKISEFALPNPNAQPWGITTGPDGALWFREGSCVREQSSRCIVGNKIGRITTAGAVTVTKANARCQPLRSAAFKRSRQGIEDAWPRRDGYN